MRLIAGDVVLTAHFAYTHHENGAWVTLCRLHEGRCNSDALGRCTEYCARTGSARCSSKDVFTKPLGRRDALARAIQFMPRPTRKLIWASYFNQSLKRGLKCVPKYVGPTQEQLAIEALKTLIRTIVREEVQRGA